MIGNVGCGMTSSPLDSTHDRQRPAWHDITALGLHTRLATSGVAWHQRPWTAHTVSIAGRCMTSPTLDSTHGRKTCGVACNHRLWAAHTIERRRAWHAIIALGRQTPYNNVRRGITSPPLDSTQGRQRRSWHDITALGLHTRLEPSGVA